MNNTNKNINGLIPIADNGFWKNRSTPLQSLHIAADLFNKICGDIIIEIGTGIHGEMSGNSMLIWPKKTSAKRIIAIDIDKNRINEVKKVTNQYSNVELIVEDGIDYLKKFTANIDLLYLDFWAPDPEGAVNGTGRAVAYLDVYNVTKKKLNLHSIILIDDTDHIHPWKHTYIIPEARKDGYRVLYTGRQTLLIR